MKFNINMGPAIVFGDDARKELGNVLAKYGCKKVLLIHDEIMAELGFVQDLVDIVGETGIELFTYAPPMGEPTVDRVDDAADFAKEKGVDGLVGLGGGATTDITKFVGKVLANGGKADDYMGYTNTGGSEIFSPVIVMPTTSGTGAEMNPGLICANSKGHKSATIHGASDVITDPYYTMGLPKSVTANTGIDAFAHAVESMANSSAMPNLMADVVNIEAARLAFKYLPIAFEDGSNVEARTQMSFAALLGGMSLRLRKTGFGHLIANQVSDAYHYPHGMGVCIGLPAFIRYYAAKNEKWIGMMAKALEIPCGDDADLKAVGTQIIETVDKWLKNLGAKSMKELDIPEEKIDEFMVGVRTDDKWKILAADATPDFDYVEQCMRDAYDF